MAVCVLCTCCLMVVEIITILHYVFGFPDLAQRPLHQRQCVIPSILDCVAPEHNGDEFVLPSRASSSQTGSRWASDPSFDTCLLYTSPSPRDGLLSRMPSSA
eukprot:TRINITY_DN7068_c0_g1_i5.p1 TRINITY_DN7068_c0_g1~~TRINITY_DN7068_c0_g1_i5.p1  ORF type:complete len:102 (-),score=7.86 TRINITY_DN7068_c0_g1_i5:34-339(-)